MIYVDDGVLKEVGIFIGLILKCFKMVIVIDENVVELYLEIFVVFLDVVNISI